MRELCRNVMVNNHITNGELRRFEFKGGPNTPTARLFLRTKKAASGGAGGFAGEGVSPLLAPVRFSPGLLRFRRL